MALRFRGTKIGMRLDGKHYVSFFKRKVLIAIYQNSFA